MSEELDQAWADWWQSMLAKIREIAREEALRVVQAHLDQEAMNRDYEALEDTR